MSLSPHPYDVQSDSDAHRSLGDASDRVMLECAAHGPPSAVAPCGRRRDSDARTPCEPHDRQESQTGPATVHVVKFSPPTHSMPSVVEEPQT
jgi:hypothetical protein